MADPFLDTLDCTADQRVGKLVQALNRCPSTCKVNFLHVLSTYPYDSPTAQITFGPFDVEPRAEKFEKYTGKGFDLDSMDEDAAAPAQEAASVAQQNAVQKKPTTPKPKA